MIVVSSATAADVGAVAEVLADSMRADDVMGEVVGGDRDRQYAKLRHLFGVLTRAGLRDGAVDVARIDADPKIVGAAVWHAPGHVDAGPGRTVIEFGAYLRAFGPFGLVYALRRGQSLTAARPATEHWYLCAIGVGGDGRGHGVGSTLIESRLDQLDAADVRVSAYLEASTERSSRLYERYGFVRTGVVPGFDTPGAPIAMLRGGGSATGERPSPTCT